MSKPFSPPSQPPLPALVHLLHTGQFDALARQARDCAARWPAAGPVWHLLGLAHLNLGQAAEAAPALAKAAKLLPRDPQVAEHLAIALMHSGQAREAYRAFERCLALAPRQPGLLINLAHLANDQGQHAAAERHARSALGAAPGQPEALFNLGRALAGQGRKEDAIAAFRQALAGAGQSAPAHNDVGLQFQSMDATGEAEACFRKAIALAPGFAPAHSNLGRLLEQQGRAAEALESLRRAAALEPGLAAIHANIGSLHNALHQFAEGEAASRQAVHLDPGLAAAHCNLGNALLGQQRHSEAEAAYRQALAVDADHGDALNNLGNLCQELRRFDEAAACYRRLKGDPTALGNVWQCAAQLADWSRRGEDETALRLALCQDAADVGPFGLLALAGDDAPELQRRAGLLYARKHFRAALAKPPLVDPASHPQRDRLRIGYLSADFHDHATMHLLAGVLAAHDRQRFAIHLYSYGPDREDQGRQQARAGAEVFRDLRLASDDDAAARIAADGIDLLVDLKGYTQDARLGITARRPAPVIVSWLGYPGTLGEERLADYIIGDPVVTPPEHAGQYSETLALMPHSYQPNDRRREIGPRPTREAEGLPAKGFVFCSFNQAFKLNPPLFDVWCRLLTSVPDSVLWLLKPPAAAMANLRREAAARGVAPERLVFADKKSLADHLGRLQLADLALDTDPYGSHTTGSDALWAGVPLLTRLGKTFASRVGASLLNAAGLPELVTKNWEEYQALALALAGDPARLAGLREGLAARRLTAPLFDTIRFTSDLEDLYLRMWEQRLRG